WNNCGWYCDEEAEECLKKLLPNHYYDHDLGRAVRMPFYAGKTQLNQSDIYELCTSILRGSYKALLRRYRPLQAITSGMDSRILLAATRQFTDAVKYYIFDFGHKERTDIQVAGQIAEDLRLNFTVFLTFDLTKQFEQDYLREHVYPRLSYATKGIQYHYMHHR